MSAPPGQGSLTCCRLSHDFRARLVTDWASSSRYLAHGHLSKIFAEQTRVKWLSSAEARRLKGCCKRGEKVAGFKGQDLPICGNLRYGFWIDLNSHAPFLSLRCPRLNVKHQKSFLDKMLSLKYTDQFSSFLSFSFLFSKRFILRI